MSDMSANVSYCLRVHFKVSSISDEFGIVFLIYIYQKRHFENLDMFTTVETRSGGPYYPALSPSSCACSPPSTIFTSHAYKCKPESFHALATTNVGSGWFMFPQRQKLGKEKCAQDEGEIDSMSQIQTVRKVTVCFIYSVIHLTDCLCSNASPV